MKNSIFVLFLLSFLFSGCITKELPSYNTYNLFLKEKTFLNNDFFVDKSINVLEPKTITSLNSRDILYSKDETTYNKYALSRWADNPSKMIQKQIADYLTNSKNYKYVTTSNLKIQSDYDLVTQLADFSQSFIDNESFAKFSIRVYLVKNSTGKVYFKNFVYKKKCNSNDALGFVKTVNIVTNNFYNDLNNFLKSNIQ